MDKTILLADDELDILKVVSFRLKKAGFKVVSVSDGQKAVEALESQKIDLVLLDLRMPKISGDQVCKFMKDNDKYKDIPVILLTATAHLPVVKEDKQIKADDFLGKPFNPNELLEKIKDFLA